MRQFEELQHPVGQHDEFEAIVVGVQARPPFGIAIDLGAAALTGRVLRVKRLTGGVLLANRGVEPLLAHGVNGGGFLKVVPTP